MRTLYCQAIFKLCYEGMHHRSARTVPSASLKTPPPSAPSPSPSASSVVQNPSCRRPAKMLVAM